ncbi:unnamed protein product [Anisakis simplex]|uniref:Dolichyl-diphosphooligosaccharide--protein glycosyltransferase subunit KCP2 n=1 Tax=Anisakis simplex TaxID=6269 RepID=A0A0M3JZC1_ANISI|nr:unnamed protein product [Anisakis simplex]
MRLGAFVQRPIALPGAEHYPEWYTHFIARCESQVPVLNAELAASRAGTMMGGLLCSVLFVFILTAISNMQMSSVGDSAKVGLIEVVICLLLAALTAASVHRVAVTV